MKESFKLLWAALKGAPAFFVVFIVTLVASVISDYGYFAFLLVSVTAGFLAAQVLTVLTSVLIGLVVFFGLYSRVRIIGAQSESLGSAIISAGAHVRTGLAQQGYVTTDEDG